MKLYSADYKLRILDEAKRFSREPGAVRALLVREGLHSSHLTRWRRRLEAGGVDALTDGAFRRRSKPSAQVEKELKMQNSQLRDQLEKAKRIIELQRQLSLLLASFDE